MNDIKKYTLNFNNSRKQLLAVVVLTILNLTLILAEINFQFLFSAIVPLLILQAMQEVAHTLGSNAILFIGIILSIASTLIYLLFHFLSKRIRVFMLIALIFFSIDALVLLVLFIGLGFDPSLILYIAFAAWILYYLIIGTQAWAKLRHTTPEQIQAALQSAKQEAEVTEINSAINELTAENTPPGDDNDTSEQ